MRKFLLVVVGSVAFIGCENKEPITCVLPNPSISSNSPVMSGDEIQLSVTEVPVADALYQWTGPNGFQSNEENPVLPSATAAMEGTYTLKIIKGICETEEIATTVDIVVNTISCTPNNNTGTFSSLFYPVSYYNITTEQGADNTYILRAGEVNSSLEITFSSYDTPEAGMYTIVEPGTSIGPNEVTVTNTSGYVYYNPIECHARTGEILVSYSGGKLYAVLCSVPFYRGTDTGSSYTGTIKVTEE